MAWRKSPPQLIVLFHEAIPRDRRIEGRQMFGCPAAFLNGHLFAGLHQDSFILKLSPADRDRLIEERDASVLYLDVAEGDELKLVGAPSSRRKPRGGSRGGFEGRPSRDPVAFGHRYWIPAFAGMTPIGLSVVSHLCKPQQERENESSNREPLGVVLRGEPGSNRGQDLKLGSNYKAVLSVSTEGFEPYLEHNAIILNCGDKAMAYALLAGYRPWRSQTLN